jgi:hypothetical protein
MRDKKFCEELNAYFPESELPYECPFTTHQFISATSPLRLTTSNFIFQLNTCGYSPFVTFSLTRGWACRLHLLLVLASAVILRSESRGTHDHILLSEIRDLEGQVPVFISPRNSGAVVPPRQWVPFSSPPTTRMATVDVFDPTSTRVATRTAYKIPRPTVLLLLCTVAAAETRLPSSYLTTAILLASLFRLSGIRGLQTTRRSHKPPIIFSK